MAGENAEIEVLTALNWKKVAPTFSNGVIDLSGPKFCLSSLRGIEVFIADSKLQPDEIILNHNRLESLVELDRVPLKRIIARSNHITFMCKLPRHDQNFWPHTKESLISLDLTGNMIKAIPDLSSMPNLKVLCLAQNAITGASFGNLAKGSALEILDLGYNKLDWPTDTAFIEASREVFPKLHKIRKITLQGNQLVMNVQNYHLIILAQIRSTRMTVKGPQPIELIDQYEVDRDMKDRADDTKLMLIRAGLMGKSDAVAAAAAAAAVTAPVLQPKHVAFSGQGGAVGEPAEDLLLADGGGNGLPSNGHPLTLAADEAHHVLDMPNIKMMIGALENCIIQPLSCLENINKITRQVHSIMHRPDGQRYLFPEQDSAKATLLIGELVQNIALLSERQPQTFRSLLLILAYLSTVSVNGLGEKCTEQLEIFMGGGEAHAIQVIDVVNEHLVPLLGRVADRNTRRLIVQNLSRLAKSSKMPPGLDRSPLENAIDYIVDSLVNSSSAPPSEGLVEMAAVASEDPKLARQLGSIPQLAGAVTKELADEGHTTKRYRSLLVLVKNLAKFDMVKSLSGNVNANEEGQPSAAFSYDIAREAALLESEDEQLVANGMDLGQLGTIGRGSGTASLDQAASHRSARSFAKANAHRIVIKNLQVLVDSKEVKFELRPSLIKQSILCLAALMHSHTVFCNLMDERVGFCQLLFHLYNTPNTGPQVFAAVIRGLTAILTAPAEWYPLRLDDVLHERYAVFHDITHRLHRVVPLLQYLGEKGVKFAPMCAMDTLGMPSRGGRYTLATLEDPDMHELIVAIIDLIAVYSREAATSDNQLATRVSQELNQHKREAFLFACLNTPSDDVRLAVVRCLQEVQLSEFDFQEINYLVSFLSNISNISSGKTEEVLGGSFKLLTRLCLSDHAAGASFRVNFAEKSANAALAILERNEQRDTRGQPVESMQKRALTTACVHFLQACSHFKALSNFMRSHEVLEKMITILHTEDSNADYVKVLPRNDLEISFPAYRPSLVERTLSGRQVEYLLRTLVGFRSVSPTQVVAPRILRRMADVLMGIPDPSLGMMRRQWLSPTIAPDGAHRESSGRAAQGGESVMDKGLEQRWAVVLASSSVDEDGNWCADYPERLPVWAREHLRDSSDPFLSFRTLANHLALRERRMGSFWNAVVGTQVGCVENWSALEFLSHEEMMQMQLQHKQLVNYSGLERLLLFLVGAVEKTLSHAGPTQVASTGTSGLPTNLSVSQLVSSFQVEDARALLEAVIARSEAAGVGSDRPDPKSLGTPAAPSSNPAAAAYMNGTTETPATRPAQVTGSELLLRFFMEETLDEAGAHRSASNPHGAARDTNGYLGHTEARPEQAYEEDDSGRTSGFPGADAIMFAPNAANLFRRDTEVTATLVAGLRVIYALIRFGKGGSSETVKSTLRDPAKLKILACICAGPAERPIWPQSLVGAKFMAICYELCAMPGVRREDSLEMLPVYSIICAVACRILSTLRFFAESSSLTEADRVTAMHTTRTVALIAAQVKYMRMPHPEREPSAATRQTGLGAVWRSLFPFESTIKGAIAILIASSRRDDSEDEAQQLVLVDACTREHVTQFLVSAFGVSSFRYEVLEELVRTQISSNRAVRSSFLQELLNRIAFAAFNESIKQFLVVIGAFPDVLTDEEEETDESTWSGASSKETALATTEDALMSPPGGEIPQRALAVKAQLPKKIASEEPWSFASWLGMCGSGRSGKGRAKTARHDVDALVFAPLSTAAPRPQARSTGERKWAIEPPPALPRKILGQASSDRSQWEIDRIGKERILASAFVDATEPGYLPARRLLVLTSEAYYMLAEPIQGAGWQVLFSAETKKSADDLHTNPILFSSPAIFTRKGPKPRLLYRRPYRAVGRLVLGLYGGRLHIQHRGSDSNEPSSKPRTLTLVTLVHGVAVKLYSLFMQLCREWAQIESSLGLAANKISVPQEEPDLPLTEAIRWVMHNIDAPEVRGADAMSGLLTGERTISTAQPDQVSSGTLVDFAPTTSLGNGLAGVLFAQVLVVIQSGATVPRAVLCTSKHFAILEADWGHWNFPFNYDEERARFIQALSQRKEKEQSLDQARVITAMKAKFEGETEQEALHRQKILAHSKKWTHSLLDLNEVLFDRGENPILTLGFGRATAQNSTSRTGRDGDDLHGSKVYYEIFFYDHVTREEWCARLLPLLKRAAV